MEAPKILVFEDDLSIQSLIGEALSKISVASFDARKPSPPVRPRVFLAANAEATPYEWEGKARSPTDFPGVVQLAKAIDDFAVLVIDLELTTFGPLCECEYCSAGLHGLHVLDIAARFNRRGVRSAFVSSANVGRAMRQFPDALMKHLQSGLSVFQRPTDANAAESPHLTSKVQAWLQFEINQYSASWQVRERLYQMRQPYRTGQPRHVLIYGATGTGKEVAARFLHDGESASFVSMPCGCFTDAGSARSELFGHVRGAYTDAGSPRLGLMLTAVLGSAPPLPRDAGEPQEEFIKWLTMGRSPRFAREDGVLRLTRDAPIGTVFLDEFQDLPLVVQAQLMRVFEQGEIRPFGLDIPINLRDGKGGLGVRIVAATNDQRVQGAIRRGAHGRGRRVRADLIFRFDELVELDDLHRSEVRHFVERSGLSLDADALSVLEAAVGSKKFPGHRRQLWQFLMRLDDRLHYQRQSGRAIEFMDSITKEDVEFLLQKIRPFEQDPESSEDARLATLADEVASRLPRGQIDRSQISDGIADALDHLWEDFDISSLAGEFGARPLAVRVANALFEVNRKGLRKRVRISGKAAWGHNKGLVRRLVYDAFSKAAHARNQQGKWPKVPASTKL